MGNPMNEHYDFTLTLESETRVLEFTGKTHDVTMESPVYQEEHSDVYGNWYSTILRPSYVSESPTITIKPDLDDIYYYKYTVTEKKEEAPVEIQTSKTVPITGRTYADIRTARRAAGAPVYADVVFWDDNITFTWKEDV